MVANAYLPKKRLARALDFGRELFKIAVYSLSQSTTENKDILGHELLQAIFVNQLNVSRDVGAFKLSNSLFDFISIHRLYLFYRSGLFASISF